MSIAKLVHFEAHQFFGANNVQIEVPEGFFDEVSSSLARLESLMILLQASGEGENFITDHATVMGVLWSAHNEACQVRNLLNHALGGRPAGQRVGSLQE